MPKPGHTRDWLKRAIVISMVPENAFFDHYLTVTPDQLEFDDWTSEQDELIGLIRGVQVGKEKALYAEMAPLLRLCNLISKRVFKSLVDKPSSALVFYPHHDKYLRNQYDPDGSLLSPDIVVVSQTIDEHTWTSDAQPNPRIWANVVAVGEEKVTDDAQYQTAHYLLAHLNDRPDLLSVLDFSADPKGYTLFYHDASVIQRTPPLPWTPRSLHAFVRRLYYGMPCDPSVVNITPYIYNPSDVSAPGCDGLVIPRPSYIIKVNSEAFAIISAKCNPGMGQRRFTAIAKHADTGKDWFIKDHYRDERHWFLEGNLLMKAHQANVLPGLMRARFHGYVLGRDEKEIITTALEPGPRNSPPVKRFKVRVATEEVGLPLSEVKALREFLGILNLYRKSKILHRDISDNNIMIAPTSATVHERWEKGYDEIKYLNQVLTWKAPPKPACLLVDLGNAVDLDQIDRTPGILTTVTGTPKFLAREGEYETYNQELEDALAGEPFPEPKFAHKLFHDAESTFWVIAWFLARAVPKDYQSETHWDNTFIKFIKGMRGHRPDVPSDEDNRLNFLPENWDKILHPRLSSVAPMLTEMHTFIDQEWSYRPTLPAEHAHDTLMRLLLVEIVRIERNPAADVEFASRTRDLPKYTQMESTSSLSTTFSSSLTASASPHSKKRSRSRSGDSESDRSRPSPRLRQLQLDEADQPEANPIDWTTFDDVLALAQKHDWNGVPSLKIPIGSIQ